MKNIADRFFGDFFFVKSTSTGVKIHDVFSNLSFINKTWHKGTSIYVLKCWNEEEEFYKVGITDNTIGRRYSTKALMPYNFSIEYEYLCSGGVALSLEGAINDTYPKHYPKISFGGHTECYIIDENIIKHIEDSLKLAYPEEVKCDFFDLMNF